MYPRPAIHLSERLLHPPRVDRPSLRELGRRIARAARRLGVTPDALAGLAVRIVDDLEMSELHERFMGERKPTDVLSFEPAPDLWEGSGGLGDLVIDWQAVERQAAAPTPAARLDEATVLAVHGLAHLLGHDHRDRREGRRMHADERRVLRALAVADPPRPYDPRISSRPWPKRKRKAKQTPKT